MSQRILSIVALMSMGFSLARAESTTTRVNVVVDPRIELLTVVQLLADWEMKSTFVTGLDYSYTRDVTAYFSQYASHAAPVMYPDMLAFGFAYDAPVQTMLHYSNPPELKPIAAMPDQLLRRCGGAENLEKLMTTLRDFAIRTDFMSFFAAHRPFYDSTIAAVRSLIGDSDRVAVLENYCGIRQHSYSMILALLQAGNHAYGPRVPSPNGTFDVYFVGGASRIVNGLPFFGEGEYYDNIFWHEFGHSFINPLVDTNAAEIMRHSSLYGPMATTMKQQAYGDWKTCATEHILRAVNARMTYLAKGEKAGDKSVLYNRSLGFAYVPALCEKLKDFESQRAKYSTLKSFFPELISVFQQLSAANLGPDFYKTPFYGTINSLLMDRASIVIVAPSTESDTAMLAKIMTSIESVRSSFFKDAPILKDTDALTADLSRKTVIAYGTPTNNLWIAKLLPSLPVRIESDRIVADSTYLGNGMRFITTWPHPGNPERGVVLYIAQQAKDVIGANGVFHGPTDYTIARGREVLKAGDYVKEGDSWRF